MSADINSVACVIPAFNAEATIASAIESAISQGEGIKIIVVDDGSRDDTLSIARSYVPRVEVLTQENKGPSAARNLGLASVDQEWTVFLDADDVFVGNTLRTRIKTADMTGSDVVICDWEEERVNESGEARVAIRQFNWAAFQADPELATATVAWAAIHAILYKTSLLKEIGGFRPNLNVAEDARLIFDCAKRGAYFVHSPHVGAHYSYIEGSQSRANKGLFWKNVFLKLSEIKLEWEADGLLTAQRSRAISDSFYVCERGLFACADPLYFQVHAARNSFGFPPPLHSRFAAPLARIIGLQMARRILSPLDRSGSSP